MTHDFPQARKTCIDVTLPNARITVQNCILQASEEAISLNHRWGVRMIFSFAAMIPYLDLYEPYTRSLASSPEKERKKLKLKETRCIKVLVRDLVIQEKAFLQDVRRAFIILTATLDTVIIESSVSQL